MPSCQYRNFNNKNKKVSWSYYLYNGNLQTLKDCFMLRWTPDARPTNSISIKLEIRSKVGVFWFKMCSTDHNKILQTPWQCDYRNVYKISVRSAEYVMNKSITKFHWISKLIVISLVGWNAFVFMRLKKSWWNLTNIIFKYIYFNQWNPMHVGFTTTRMIKCTFLDSLRPSDTYMHQ